MIWTLGPYFDTLFTAVIKADNALRGQVTHRKGSHVAVYYTEHGIKLLGTFTEVAKAREAVEAECAKSK